MISALYAFFWFCLRKIDRLEINYNHFSPPPFQSIYVDFVFCIPSIIFRYKFPGIFFETIKRGGGNTSDRESRFISSRPRVHRQVSYKDLLLADVLEVALKRRQGLWLGNERHG